MKELNMYYVKDLLADEVISPPIPMKNDLVAAIAFRDQYIKNKPSPKNPYNFKNLILVRFAQYDVQDNGELFKKDDPCQERVTIPGEQIIPFIREKCEEANIDDSFLDEEEEENK